MFEVRARRAPPEQFEGPPPPFHHPAASICSAATVLPDETNKKQMTHVNKDTHGAERSARAFKHLHSPGYVTAFAHVLCPLQLFFSSCLFHGLGVGGNSVCRGSRRLREDALSLSQTIEFSRTSETCPFTSVYVTVLLQYTCRWL